MIQLVERPELTQVQDAYASCQHDGSTVPASTGIARIRQTVSTLHTLATLVQRMRSGTASEEDQAAADAIVLGVLEPVAIVPAARSEHPAQPLRQS